MNYKCVKRSLDLVLSILAIIFLFPVCLICAIGIKVSSKGTVLYKARRVGVDRTPFTMYKFRTMHEEDNAQENSFIADESRMFPFGELMRKSKLDELMQLFNIVKSDMSIVGPRPASVESVDKIYGEEYQRIFSVKPGLTSLASIFDYKHGELFINDNDKYIKEILPIKLELELAYVEQQSFRLDVQIVVETIITIIAILCGKQKFKYTKMEKKAIKAASKRINENIRGIYV